MELIEVGQEAGLMPQRRYSSLAQAGAPICIENRHAKAILEVQVNKMEREDARGIAQMMLGEPVAPRARQDQDAEKSEMTCS